jgi:uncharacterized protein YciI
MEFLFYCRDKPGVGALLEANVEAHWSFMDGYGDRLITRGPTLSDDGEEHTGSLHIVRLDKTADTERFAYQEPFYRAGAYRAVIIRRWRDRTGRSMRDFRTWSADPLFLVLGDGAPSPAQAVLLGDRAAVFGWTEPIAGAGATGFAAILQAPGRDAVKALLGDATLEIHRWIVGGRR